MEEARKEEQNNAITLTIDDPSNSITVNIENHLGFPGMVSPHITEMYEIKYNFTLCGLPGVFLLHEYQLILFSENENNNSKTEIIIYLYMNKDLSLFIYDDVDEELNTDDNINIINFISRINFLVSKDPIVERIFPAYEPKVFINLFLLYLYKTSVMLVREIGLTKFDLLSVYLEHSSVNDKIINEYFKLIKKRANKNTLYVLDTFFWIRFSKFGFRRVKKDTRKNDIFSFEKLLIPIYISNLNHWALICVDILKKSILYFDSCKESKIKNIIPFSNKIVEYLGLEFRDKKKAEPTCEWKIIDGNSPLQNNCHDGGVFICANGELFSRNEKSDFFNHTHINLYRQKIVCELLNFQLLV